MSHTNPGRTVTTNPIYGPSGLEDPPEFHNDGRVRWQPWNGVELIDRKPPQRGVLQGLGYAAGESGEPYPQHGASVRERHIATDAVADRDGDAQLLLALAYQGFQVGLPRLNLPAGELPSPGRLGRLGPFA